MVINTEELLYEICGDKRVYDPDTDLIETGILDSLAVIELFSRLEDEGIELQPTQIDRDRLRTPKRIRELVEEAAGT